MLIGAQNKLARTILEIAILKSRTQALKAANAAMFSIMAMPNLHEFLLIGMVGYITLSMNRQASRHSY